MGGGNGQKAKMAREKNLEKSKGSKGSQLESNKKAMNIQCKICMQTFMCTTSEVKCRSMLKRSTRRVMLLLVFRILKNDKSHVSLSSWGDIPFYVKSLLLCLGILLGPKLLVISCGCSCQSKWSDGREGGRSHFLVFSTSEFKCYHFVDSYISISHEYLVLRAILGGFFLLSVYLCWLLSVVVHHFTCLGRICSWRFVMPLDWPHCTGCLVIDMSSLFVFGIIDGSCHDMKWSYHGNILVSILKLTNLTISVSPVGLYRRTAELKF